METTESVHERKKAVRLRLLRALADERITPLNVDETTGRGLPSLGRWLSGEQLPPGTLLGPLERMLDKAER